MKPCIKKIFLLPVLVASLGLFPTASTQAQVQWTERIASVASLPEGEANIGMTLDTNGNCYVTGWFDDTNNFGGVTLTNQSVGGSDIFVAEYNSTGALQWVQRAGGNSVNYGRGVGVDTNGNIYVTGGFSGPAKFGSINLSGSSGVEFFLAKYSNSGTVQWVKPASGGSSDVYGSGLAVDGAGNSYAMVVVDHLSGQATNITFGSTTIPIPATENWPFGILIKYDSNGTVKWTQVLGTSEEVYVPGVAVDAAGNVYLHGIFISSLTIGTSNLVVSDGLQHLFIAKFSNSGNVTWIQQPQSHGYSSSDGGVAVDPAENVYVSGMYQTNLNFGGGIILTNSGSYNAFLAKYNSSGAIQWAQMAGGTNDGEFADFYVDLALDGQTNVYAAGDLNSDAAVAKYSSTGSLQWTYSASGPPASPLSSMVWRCRVDSSNNCYLAGWYLGTTTFGAILLSPQETWNIFLAKVTAPNFTTLHSFTGPPGDGANPQGGLVVSGNMFYGTCDSGGSAGNGTEFALNTKGTVMSQYSFSTTYASNVGVYTNGDGTGPDGTLIISGNTLYGTAYYGGTNGNGAVFKVNTNGTGFTTLHSFAAGSGSFPWNYINSDGACPEVGLILSGNTLYGTTEKGGSNGYGAVFKVNTDGTGF